jgi:DNA polymerase bacteriophage-type
MRTLAIDIETFSDENLKNSGVYRYAESLMFEILLLSYAYDNDPVTVVDLACGEELPKQVINDLCDPNVLKTAHNAAFERTCIAQFTGYPLPAEQWECTMVKSSMAGLPASLDQVASVLKLEQQKDVNGKALIKYFSMPCKPTRVNGQRTRNLPSNDPAKWELFKKYCIQDVVVEREIRSKLTFFETPKTERKLWRLDQIINDRGVLVDKALVKNAINLDTMNASILMEKAVELTGLRNPNSAAQLKIWLKEEMPLDDIDTLKKEDIPTYIKNAEGYVGAEAIKEVLEIRQMLAKASVKKYLAMDRSVCDDSRIRGLLQYYGANRTGRWAGRLVQVQNLTKHEITDLDIAREIVKLSDYELLDLLYGNVSSILSQLIRTSFVAPKGSRFIVADFSAIEARVIAWLAGEKWRLDVFNTHGKIYEASAAQMFKVPLESVTKGSDLRQKGKVSELALGYQGGPNALIKMGALKMGLTEAELPALVKMWRNANRKIGELWNAVNDAAVKAVESGEKQTIGHGISFYVQYNTLFIELPSGRQLCYYKPHLVDGKYGSVLRYWGMDQVRKKWCVQDTYGGKLVENIVQAIARDCLADAMLRLEEKEYYIVMHVHDEIVAEMPYGKGSLEEVNRIMGTEIPWAKGLPLKADSYETEYYKKD